CSGSRSLSTSTTTSCAATVLWVPAKAVHSGSRLADHCVRPSRSTPRKWTSPPSRSWEIPTKEEPAALGSEEKGAVHSISSSSQGRGRGSVMVGGGSAGSSREVVPVVDDKVGAAQPVSSTTTIDRATVLGLIGMLLGPFAVRPAGVRIALLRLAASKDGGNHCESDKCGQGGQGDHIGLGAEP